MVCFPGRKTLRRQTQRTGIITRYVSLLYVERLIRARDRVHLLLDPDTPFLELGAFAGYKLDSSSPSASLITGIGVIWYTPSVNGR